jgi:hypothetical protein
VVAEPVRGTRRVLGTLIMREQAQAIRDIGKISFSTVQPTSVTTMARLCKRFILAGLLGTSHFQRRLR